MSQSTDELTRSELRAIPGHYRRRVWLAFLIPALTKGNVSRWTVQAVM
jgi:hypothetical protein